MTTSLENISDLFLSLSNDFRLTALYQTSGSVALNDYLEPFLLFSIDDFADISSQDLTYSTTTQLFTETLTQKNKNILAQIMTKYHLQRELQNIMQMTNFIVDKDFKTYSAANNLKEKRELYNAKREEVSQLLIDYGYKNNDWDSWELQEFS